MPLPPPNTTGLSDGYTILVPRRIDGYPTPPIRPRSAQEIAEMEGIVPGMVKRTDAVDAIVAPWRKRR